MSKIILSVQQNVNLTAQTPKYMQRTGRELKGVNVANLTVDFVKSLGDPSVVSLIHFYLSTCDSRVIQVILELNRLGYVMMFSLNNVQPTSNSQSFIYSLGLTTQIETWNITHPTSFYTAPNDFFKIAGYTSGGITVTYKPSGNNFGCSILRSTLKQPMTEIAYTNSNADSIYFGIFEVGTMLSDGTVSRAPIIFGGFLYASENHTENIYDILDDIYIYSDSMAKFKYIVEGYVSTNNHSPLIRKVTAHRQSTGQLVGSTMSDENGSYLLGFSVNEPVFIVCHPEDSSKRGLIHTYVIPVENERD